MILQSFLSKCIVKLKGDLWSVKGDLISKGWPMTCEMWTCFFFLLNNVSHKLKGRQTGDTHVYHRHSYKSTHTHTYPYWKYIHVHPCNKFSSSCFWIWCVYIYIWIIQVDKGIMLYYDNISIFVLLNCTVKLPPPFHYIRVLMIIVTNIALVKTITTINGKMKLIGNWSIINLNVTCLFSSLTVIW